MNRATEYFNSVPSCSCTGEGCSCGFIYLFKTNYDANTDTEGQREEN